MSFIILGNQRSGTNFILDVINHHPDVQTINEPFSMHLDFFHNNEEPWEGESFNDVYLHEKLKGLDETITFIQDLNRWMNCDYPMVRGFKETGLFEKFDWLYRAVRPKKVVIIVRDFRAIVNSVLRRNLHRNKWNYERILFEHYGIKGMNNDAELCAKLISLRTNYLIRIHEKYGCPIIRLEDIIRFPQQNVSLLILAVGFIPAGKYFPDAWHRVIQNMRQLL